MNRFIQKLRRIILGQPAETHAVEPQNDVPYVCGIMLLRMKAEQGERDLASSRGEKSKPKDKQ